MALKNQKAEELLAYLCCTGGRPAKKKMLEELLWPDSERGRARDSFYKVCRYLEKWQRESGIKLPLTIYREEVYLDINGIETDLQRFQIYYDSNNPQDWAVAEKMYVAPLLFENCYEWTGEYEGSYDMKYYELLRRLITHCEKHGEKDKQLFYKGKLQGFR